MFAAFTSITTSYICISSFALPNMPGASWFIFSRFHLRFNLDFALQFIFNRFHEFNLDFARLNDVLRVNCCSNFALTFWLLWRRKY